MKRFAYRLSMWLLRKSGDAGADAWRELVGQRDHMQASYTQADAERWRVLGQLRRLKDAAKLADGLLSTGQHERAQEQLRIGLLAAGETPYARKAS